MLNLFQHLFIVDTLKQVQGDVIILQKSEKNTSKMLLIGFRIELTFVGSMNTFINWLSKHKALNLVLVFAYGTSLIFLHNFFVQLSVKAMNSLSLAMYNSVVMFASITLGISIIAYLLYRLLKTAENRKRKLFFLLITCVLIIAHFMIMFEMNIEIIHGLEFMFLSVLLFPLTGSFGAAIIFCLPFIFINEWYQYAVLYQSYIHYFEFNDIVIDLLGCGLSMIFLWISGIKPKENSTPYLKKPEFIFLVGVNLLFPLMLLTCVFSLYATTKCDNTFLILNQLENPHLFWQKHVYGAIYHVMKPIEGMIAITLICSFYSFMDKAALSK